MTGWKVVEFDRANPGLRREAARMLVDGFREHWPEAWPTLASAEAEVREALSAEKVALAAVTAPGSALLGWIGGQPEYRGRVWELHPLVVRREDRGRGVGRSLILRLEEVRARGALTLWAGTDDEAKLTSLGGLDLYPNVLGKLLSVENLGGHPMGFYLTFGFELVGVVPDANGFGKPDLLMAKRVVGGEDVFAHQPARGERPGRRGPCGPRRAPVPEEAPDDPAGDRDFG